MKKSGWILLPAAFFLALNFSISEVKVLFVSRLLYFSFFISLFFFIRRFELKRIFRPLVGGISLILFIYGLVQKFILFPYYLANFSAGKDFYSDAIITRIKTGRIFSIFSLPTLYAIVCAVLILFIFHYLVKSTSLLPRLFWIFLLLLGLLNLVLTQSFAGIPYVGIGILLYLTFSGVLKLNHAVYIVMFLALIFFLVTGLRYTEAKELVPLKMRFSNWEQATRMTATAPFLGKGLGNYESEITSFTVPGQARSIYAHNFILQFTAECGIPALLILLLVLWAAGKKSIPPVFHQRKMWPPGNLKKIDNEEILYIAVFCILIVYNLIDIGFYFFPAALVGVLCLSQIYRNTGKGTGLWQKINIVALCLLAVLLLGENLSDTYQKRGDYWTSRKDFAAAETAYLQSIKINPNNIRALSGLSFIKLTYRRDLASSEQYADDVLAIYPASPSASFLKATILLRKREYFRAFTYARTAMQRNRFDRQYKELYEYLENHLQAKLSEPGS